MFVESACTYFDGCPQIYIRYYFTAKEKNVFFFLLFIHLSSLPLTVFLYLARHRHHGTLRSRNKPRENRKIARNGCCYAHFKHQTSHKNYSNKFMTLNSITFVATNDIWEFSFSFSSSYPVPFPLIYKYNSRSVN